MTDQMQSDLLCEVCNTNTRVSGYGEQFGTLGASWGYGALHDGERYRVHLCEPCFFGALAYLREQRRVRTMFDDDQPKDDQVFGRVARDDYFGGS
jgi:hypothetical protein